MTYKKASSKAQAKTERITLADFVKGGEDLIGEDRLKMLKEELHKLELQILRCETTADRRLLGKRKFVLQTELSRLKERKRPGLESIYAEVARRLLPPELDRQIWEEAKHVYDIRNRPKNDAVNEQTYLQAELLGVEI